MGDVVVPLRSGGVIPATVQEPDVDVISKLEEWLANAKSGHVRVIGYAIIDRDRAIMTGWVGHGDHHDMTAGVNLLAFRYMTAGRDEDE